MKCHSTESRALSHIRDLLQAQLVDPENMARVHRAAEAAARVPRDSLIARELVADVVGEMYAGALSWDLDQVPIATHLINEVRRRARRGRRQQAIHVPLERLRGGEMRYITEPYPSGDDRGSEIDPADLPQLLSELRVHAADDGEILQLLALAEPKKVRVRDALRLGMSVTKYRAARRRLMRLVSKVLAATPGTRADHPMSRAASEAKSAIPSEHDVNRSADPMSAIGLLLAATRFGPRRAEPPAASEDRARQGA